MTFEEFEEICEYIQRKLEIQYNNENEKIDFSIGLLTNFFREICFESRICAQTMDLEIFKKFNMPQMNPKEVLHNSRSLPLKYFYF